MTDDKEKIKTFKRLLDQLPYITEWDKLSSSTMYLCANDTIRSEMEEFYKKQATDYQIILGNYNQEVEAAKQDFQAEIETILSPPQSNSPASI